MVDDNQWPYKDQDWGFSQKRKRKKGKMVGQQFTKISLPYCIDTI